MKEKDIISKPVTKNITSYDPIGDEHKYLTKTWKWTEKNQSADDYHFELELTGFRNLYRLEIKSKSGSYSSSQTWTRKPMSKMSHLFGSTILSFDFTEAVKNNLDRMIETCKFDISGSILNKEFLEDFPKEDIRDFFLDLKDLLETEIKIEFNSTNLKEDSDGKIKIVEPFWKIVLPYQKEKLNQIKEEIQSLKRIESIGLKMSFQSVVKNSNELLEFKLSRKSSD